MASYPSFLFSGINSSMKELNDELNELGGGSARISELEYDCVIDDRIHQDSYQILWPLGKSIGLRNAKLPKNHPVAESMRYFPVSAVSRYSTADYSKTSIHYPQSRNVAQWLMDGFNASVIGYGCNPSKTESLYGSELSNRSEPNNRKGFVYEILRDLYQKIQENTENISTILSVSVWALKGNDVIDLCASPIRDYTEEGDQRDKKNWLEFVSVECPDYETAIKIIDVARYRAHHRVRPQKDRDNCHLFLRILLHSSLNSDISRHKGSISHLHIVDLTSLSTPDGFDINRMEEEDRIARRESSLQLNSLCKVLCEIRDITREANNKNKNRIIAPSYSQTKITSARDSKLTLILAPLIQGNTKTWFFLHLKDGEENYPTVLHTLSSLEGIGDIQSACHHVKDIPLNSLKLKHADSVLPPEYELKSSKFQLLPPQPHSREQQSKQQQDAHGTLPSSTSNKIPRGKSPSIESIAKEEIKLTNLLSSTEFDHLMEEFNTLMAQVEQKPPIRSTTPIHPAYSSSKSMTEYPLKSSFYDPFSVGRPESQSQDRVGLLPTLANQVPDQHSSGHPQEVQEFKSDEDEEMENMIHTSNRYINRNNLNYQSDDTNPPQPPSPSSTYYYSHHLRGRSKSEGENSDEESDWERNISHHSRKYDYPQSTSVLRDSLESNREVESLQQERNRRKEFEQQRTGIKSDFFHLNHERKENDQEISNHYQYHDQDPDYDQDDDQDHDQDQDRGLDEEYLYDSYQYQNSKQQQPIASEFSRYSQFPNDRHGDDDDLEINSQASYTKMDKMEKESGFMSTTEEKDKFTGRIGPEELQLINESLMASLQIEREAKEKIQAENRALEEELLEAKTTKDIQEEGHKVEILRLKSQIRKLLTEHSYEDILVSFEEDLSRLINENTVLKQRNMYLEDLKETKILAGGGDFNTTTTVGDPGISWSVTEGMVGAHGETSVSIREYRNLRTQYKKLEKNYSSLSSAYEELRRNERHYLLAIKQYDENQRKLKLLSNQNKEIESQYTSERNLRLSIENDLSHLKEEIISLQFSERTIREERSRILSELSYARQRVRELTDQIKENNSINRFISKHGPTMAPTPTTPNRSQRSSKVEKNESSSTSAYSSRYLDRTPGKFSESSTKLHQSLHNSHLTHHQLLSSSSSSHAPHPSDALSGVAGLSNAIYLREEEMEPVSLPLEQSLLSLHDSIALTAPSLLPLVQKLGHELRNERTKSHRQKVDLLAKLTNTANSHQSSIPTSSSTTTPLKSTKPKQSSNKSPSETASRGRSTMKIHHSFKDRSRSRSAGSVGDTSVSSHASYRTTRSQDSTSKLSYNGTNSTPKIVFFRRANDN